uniref:Reverse transcriptase domain-containing protein n=1 Tax=Batrachocottus baicalensis TaxID=37346 RepID=Q90247_9TELE|nr:orf2 [Batrachocottus baicalensis]
MPLSRGKAGSTVRVMFFDFSSAFNTIQPLLLRDKLEQTGVDHHLTAWILDYLTNRPQYVRIRECESDRVSCSTGAPQGTVLAPFLFSIYTSDFKHNSANCHLQKFSDDSAIVGLISADDDREYRELNQDFLGWCQRNRLQINSSKTKELVVDFRRGKRSPPLPLSIQGLDIEMVTSYKYLGVHLNNKLDWSDHAHALYKKGQSRLFLLRRLRSFGVQGALLKTFFDSVGHQPSSGGRDTVRVPPLWQEAGSIRTKTSRHKNSFFPSAVGLINRARSPTDSNDSVTPRQFPPDTPLHIALYLNTLDTLALHLPLSHNTYTHAHSMHFILFLVF